MYGKRGFFFFLMRPLCLHSHQGLLESSFNPIESGPRSVKMLVVVITSWRMLSRSVEESLRMTCRSFEVPEAESLWCELTRAWMEGLEMTWGTIQRDYKKDPKRSGKRYAELFGRQKSWASFRRRAGALGGC